MTETLSTHASAPTGVSRRRILHGAAWAAPAIVIASAIPAAAASPNGVADIVFNDGSAIGFQEYFWNGSANVPVWTISGGIRWSSGGVYPEPQSVSGLVVTIRIPQAYATGVRYDLYGGSVGAGWTPVGSAPVLSGGYWTMTYAYGPAIGPAEASTQTTGLGFAMRAIQPVAPQVVEAIVTGTSAGQAVSLSGLGPQTL